MLKETNIFIKTSICLIILSIGLITSGIIINTLKSNNDVLDTTNEKVLTTIENTLLNVENLQSYQTDYVISMEVIEDETTISGVTSGTNKNDLINNIYYSSTNVNILGMELVTELYQIEDNYNYTRINNEQWEKKEGIITPIIDDIKLMNYLISEENIVEEKDNSYIITAQIPATEINQENLNEDYSNLKIPMIVTIENEMIKTMNITLNTESDKISYNSTYSNINENLNINIPQEISN